MQITALLCVRNELPYLKLVLPYLAGERIEVVLIDNGSTDGTLDAIRNGDFPNVIRLETFPYAGGFDLSRQLEIKWAIAKSLLATGSSIRTPTKFCMRRQAGAAFVTTSSRRICQFQRAQLQRARHAASRSASGRHLPQQQELLLLRAETDAADEGVETNRQSRAGKSGGHTLQGEDVNVYPQRMLLKHFIVRTQEHAYEKYLHRTFSSTDLEKGWHKNRLNFTVDNLRIPTTGEHLLSLASPMDVPGRLPRPTRTHFWEWPR